MTTFSQLRREMEIVRRALTIKHRVQPKRVLSSEEYTVIMSQAARIMERVRANGSVVAVGDRIEIVGLSEEEHKVLWQAEQIVMGNWRVSIH